MGEIEVEFVGAGRGILSQRRGRRDSTGPRPCRSPPSPRRPLPWSRTRPQGRRAREGLTEADTSAAGVAISKIRSRLLAAPLRSRTPGLPVVRFALPFRDCLHDALPWSRFLRCEEWGLSVVKTKGAPRTRSCKGRRRAPPPDLAGLAQAMASRAFWNRLAWERSALARVSTNQRFRRSSSRAVLAMPDTCRVLVGFPSDGRFELSEVVPMGRPMAGSPTSSMYSRWPWA